MNKASKIIQRLHWRELAKGAFLSFCLFVIPIIGLVNKKSSIVIWQVLGVVQICCALLWWIIRSNFFVTSSWGTRRIGAAFKYRKQNKLGFYSDSKKKHSKSIAILKKSNRSRSKQGIFFMLIIGVLEMSIALLFTYA